MSGGRASERHPETFRDYEEKVVHVKAAKRGFLQRCTVLLEMINPRRKVISFLFTER